MEASNIELPTREEAEKVLAAVIDIVHRYDSITVADIKEIVGLPTTHEHHKWGWRSSVNFRIRQTRNGYSIDFPNPVELVDKKMIDNIVPVNVNAPCYRVSVVAAKNPRHWIIRGISNWTSVSKIQEEVERFVGRLNEDIEWTTHTYHWPGYLERPVLKNGIWKWGFTEPKPNAFGYPDHWKEKWSQYKEGPTLLHIPKGW